MQVPMSLRPEHCMIPIGVDAGKREAGQVCLVLNKVNVIVSYSAVLTLADE